MNKYHKLSVIYNVCIVILAVASITLTILDFANKVNLNSNPYMIIDYSILVLFAIDYIVRFYIAENKLEFFKKNILDLIAIIPFSSIFSIFRFSRLLRIVRLSRFLRLTKFVRLIAFANKVRKSANKFLNTNGFIYMLYLALSLIFISSLLMMWLENRTFPDALWWSIVTCTTVGYGDISPSSATGRIVAVVLMIFGIGFISMLTGTITTFFANQTKDKSDLKRAEELIEKLSPEELKELLDKYIDEDK